MATGSRIFQLPEHLRPADVEKLKFIEEIMEEAGSVQEKVLEEILARNGETEYLKRLGLDVATDVKTFKEKVPLITYEDMQPDVQRIADGDRSPILTSQPVVQFLTSSGTSAGERKLFPVTQEELDRRSYLWSLMVPIINCYVPDLDKGKGLYFYFVKSEIKTRGGIPAMPVLTSFYKSEAFRSRPYDPYTVLTSPTEAILCPDAFQSMYVQMLCGLYQREEVLRIGTIFASSLLRAIRFLQVNWEDLAHDIALGTLNDKITDESVRSCGSVVELLKPDLELAELIRKECSCGNWEGIVRRIWPNTKYLDVIITGPMAQYISTLESYSGGLPMASSLYASSECYFGLNLRPICKPSEVSYTLFPNMAYFEFLPHGSGTDKADLVDLVDVEVGKEYEIVVTTHSGLYRYQIGDILRVSGYKNAAPQFEFVRRKNVLLSIESDKTDEVELHNAVKYASGLLNNYNASVMEYTSRVDTSTIPAHYVIYWELTIKESSKLKPEGDVIEKCCLAIEEKLSSVYRQGRVETKSIGPLEIRVVRAGTFEELMDFALSKTASFNQYKLPRCVNSIPLIELLESNVVSKHFSPSLPTGKTLC